MMNYVTHGQISYKYMPIENDECNKSREIRLGVGILNSKTMACVERARKGEKLSQEYLPWMQKTAKRTQTRE